MSHVKYIAAAFVTWYFVATGNCAGSITSAVFTGVFMASAAYASEFKKLQDQRDEAWRYMTELKKTSKGDEHGNTNQEAT